MGRRYGPVFSLRLGTQLVVVVNGYRAIRDALVKKGEFCNSRPHMPIMERTTRRNGIVNAVFGPSWKEQRTFTLHVLRNFGMGRSIVEDRVSEECLHLKKAIESFDGNSFDPTHVLTNGIANIISSIIFGGRFEYDDPFFRTLLRLCNKNFELAGSVAISNFFPVLQYIPFGPMREIVDNFEIYRKFLNGKIEEHRQSFDPDNVHDVVSAYLHEMNNRKEEQREPGHFNDDNLFAVVSDLFAAGTETTSTTLRWAVLYFALYPDVQKRVQAELDEVVGMGTPTLANRRQLPYTEATIHEIQRMSSIVPLCIPHAASENTEILGHYIPKDTVIMVNLWSALNDPDTWTNPEQFNPERFLDDKGQVEKPDELIPFSIGRRVCLGEQLAKTELFLIITQILHQFTITIAEEENQDMASLLKPVAGITLSPQPYKIQAVNRHAL
uniref:Cytochrome P450 2U1-like n=1 Tax=Saccoglossus kowalevskii TaxID=10224 RepID=A0ABM0LW06_SACKO|nr:PREDICTED: cytochrome P450 2U1-like [Saccoglossus kowalevskii]